MAYSKFIALMFGTQQIGDYLYGRKSRDGDFDCLLYTSDAADEL